MEVRERFGSRRLTQLDQKELLLVAAVAAVAAIAAVVRAARVETPDFLLPPLSLLQEATATRVVIVETHAAPLEIHLRLRLRTKVRFRSVHIYCQRFRELERVYGC